MRSTLVFWALLAAVATEGFGQDYGARLGTVRRGGQVSYEPTGPGVLFDALDPVVRKWYVPQELYAEYRDRISASAVGGRASPRWNGPQHCG